jgi:hypothetical protein
MPVKDRSAKKNPELMDAEAEREAIKEGKKPPVDTSGLEEIESRKKEAKVKTTENASDIKREVLGSEVVGADKETVELIASIDTEKSSSEQLQAWSRLETVSYTLLGKLFDKGFKKELLQVLESFRSIDVPQDMTVNGPEKVVLKKLKEIASQTASPLFLDKKESWKEFVEKAYSVYKKSAKAREYLENPGEDEKAPWLVKQIKKHPVAAAVCMGAGVYGIYHFFFSDDTESSSGGEKKESLMDKIGLGGTKKKLIGTALALLVLGTLVGQDKITEYLGKLSNLSTENLEKAWELIKQGKIKEAAAALFAGEAIDKAKEKASEAYKWLDDKVHFGKMKDSISEFCKEYKIESPDWVKDITLDRVAQEMGISKENESSWLSFAEVGGIAGGALLLYHYTKRKGILLNAGIYLFLIRNGKEGLAGELLHNLAGEMDKVKTVLAGKLQNVPCADLIIEDAFDGFNLQNSVDKLLDWMKEHPLEAMAIMNGMWLGRHLIFVAMKKLAKSTGQVAKYAWNNPGKAALATAGFAALYAGRRTHIKSFVDAMYDDPGSKEAKDMLTRLDSLMGVDRNKPEELHERQAAAFIKSVTEDPIEVLKRITTIENYRNGDYSLVITVGGAVMLLVKGFSAPIQLTKLTWESFSTSLAHLYSPDYEGNFFVPMLVGGAEAFVFGSMAWEGFKAYRTVLSSADSNWGKLLRGMKSLVPGMKEWRFVFRSCALGIPGVEAILRRWESISVRQIQTDLRKIQELVNKDNPDFGKIREIAQKMKNHNTFSEFQEIKKNLPGTTFGYETAKRLEDVNETIRSINEAAKTQETGKIKKLVADADIRLEGIKTGTRSILTRVKYLREGNFKEAFAMVDAAEDMKRAKDEAEKIKTEVDAVKPLQMREELFRGKDGAFKSVDEMKKEADRLKKEISALEDSDLLKKTKLKELSAVEAFLDPARSTTFKFDTKELEKLDEAGKAARLEKAAMELESAEKGLQARFNHEVEKIVGEARLSNTPLTDPAVMEKLEKLDRDFTIPFAEKKQSALQDMYAEFKKLPRKDKTATLVAQLRHANEGVDGTLMTRFAKGAKGRGKMMVLMGALIFATDQLIHKDQPERELMTILEDLGPEAGQLLLDVSPVFGTFSNYYSAFSGREIVTKRDVSGTWDRVSNVAWGTVGLAGDIITVLGAVPSGGGSIGANAALRLTKAAKGGSKAAIKVLKYWPRIEKIADRLGGFSKLAEKILKYLKSGSKVAKGFRAIEKVAMATGTAIMVGGIAYHLRYAFVDTKTEVEIPPEIADTEKLPTADKPAEEPPPTSEPS